MRDQETDRAEVFDALGHPTRINILKLLSHEAASFADLKKKTDIDSSGHLQHHLTKLDGLIKTDEHGNYRLSDAGNDALFVMQTVEAVSRKGRRRLAPYSRKSRMLLSTIVVVLAAILVVSTWHLSSVNFNLNEDASQTLNIAHSQYANLTQSTAQYAASLTQSTAQYAANLTQSTAQYVTNLTESTAQFAAQYSEYAAQVQYIAQNQYVCDIMTGSLWEEGRLKIGRTIPLELPPQEWFNFTAVVISELNFTGISYTLSNSATVHVFSPPERNDTYYRQGFLRYDVTVYGPNGADLYRLRTYPIIGPDGWDGQVVWVTSPYFEEIPPYPTVQTSRDIPVEFSGGSPWTSTTIVPIATFGNYTFCLRNEGDTTMQVTWTIRTPVVTFETRPLQEGDYPAWSPNFADERIVRIRQQSGLTPPSPPTMPSTPPTMLLLPPTVPSLPPTMPSLPALPDTATAAFNAATLAILSTTILAVLGVFIINRRKM